MWKRVLVLLLVLGGTSTAFAKRPPVGVGVTVGTLGAGLTATVPIMPVLNARLLVTGVRFGAHAKSGDLDYNGHVTLFNVGGLLDYHPFHNGLRASAGLIYTGNRFNGTATCQPSSGSSCDAGGSYTVNKGDRISGRVDYSGPAPYVGIGWGDAVDKQGRFSFSFDLGAMFTGSPDVSTHCERASDPAACHQAAVQARHKLKHDLGNVSVFPVLSLGVAYRL